MRLRVLLLSGATTLGCAGRDVPVRFAEQSALSAGAREAPVANPAVALGADPPLPGEALGAWTGLAVDAGTPSTSGHSHAH
ncbi:MAG: hypothetical protein Q8S73_06025 [Deltaproteobacteria bacterium]|nr:hypothetical protein [Myxococcales bacterium]MDP3213640.1 hypothetical protein [Deltaproteobacteria bacterium]